MELEIIMKALFSGLAFWGSEYFPQNLILSIDQIREWAKKENLIWDVEAQFISPERISILSRYLKYEDQLYILINLYKDESGKLHYLEYPYLPIKTLIKKAIEIEVMYWQMRPGTWYADGRAKEYNEVRIGFLYSSIGEEEFCTMSNAKLVVKKFYDLYYLLPDAYEKKELGFGVLELEVNADVKAKFFKTGRLFDVELTCDKLRI